MHGKGLTWLCACAQYDKNRGGFLNSDQFRTLMGDLGVLVRDLAYSVMRPSPKSVCQAALHLFQVYVRMSLRA